MRPARIAPAGFFALVLCCAGALPAPAKPLEDWLGNDFRPALDGADLVLVARIEAAGEMTVSRGGKTEREVQEVTFTPGPTLKGVYSRPALKLTTEDWYREERDDLRRQIGRHYLLFLERGGYGFYVRASRPIAGPEDALVAAARTLLHLRELPTRGAQVLELLATLKAVRGLAAVPLLKEMERRAFLARGEAATLPVLRQRWDDGVPGVRAAVLDALARLLAAPGAPSAVWPVEAAGLLLSCAAAPGATARERVAFLAAVAALGPYGKAQPWLWSEVERSLREGPTLAERAAAVAAAQRLDLVSTLAPLDAALAALPLDAGGGLESPFERALCALQRDQGIARVGARLERKWALDVRGDDAELGLLGELRAIEVLPALLRRLEQVRAEGEPDAAAALAGALARLPDARVVPALLDFLERFPERADGDLYRALEPFPDESVTRALGTRMKQEFDLGRKLLLAEILGERGVRDGFAYALEHLSEGHVREQAARALLAIRAPQTAERLQRILEDSHDERWMAPAMEVLARLGDAAGRERVCAVLRGRPQGDLTLTAIRCAAVTADAEALGLVRGLLRSRDEAVAYAAADALAGAPLDAPLRATFLEMLADRDVPAPTRHRLLEALAGAPDAPLADPALAAALAALVQNPALEGTPLLDLAERTVPRIR